jgi:hypothetical protein
VAVDDHNSFYMGFAHLNSYNAGVRKMTRDDFGVDQIPFIGQTQDRPHAERQREPGDFDAVVTQGAVANRKAEHLGSTDRGVVLFRRLLANAIHTTAQGQVPVQPRLTTDQPVSTYAHEVVMRVPADVDLDDPQRLAQFGREAALCFVEFDHLPPLERERAVEKKVRDILQSMAHASAK